MDYLPPEVAARLDAYVDNQEIAVEGSLGWGLEGFVWRTSRRTALKIHRWERRYEQERNVYLRLTERSLHRLAGFSIPILIHYDDSCLVLELSIVDRPFVLDFGEASLDVPIPELDDPAWLREKSRRYGPDWPDVQRLLNALRQYGIYFRDVHPKYISVRP